ncbi:hypothetical protein Pcinc_008727 [Petrolisthes cinctipes]|uniref:Uncharacterized protein n=1 Tax=Petrolisthes cinctipes TaxID=88211 RepID=A0AAE1KX75_PETCI|nr:hypothetical protein Pcinc_008727 [Petrolisthes cinctipes]
MQSIKKLKKPDDTGNVTNIVVSTPGVSQILHSKMQNLIKRLKKPKETGNVINIMMTTPGAGQIQLPKMLVGMIPHDWNSIMVKEVVNLLQQAGVNRRDQWLDIIEDTKCTDDVLTVIADHFPLPCTC